MVVPNGDPALAAEPVFHDQTPSGVETVAVAVGHALSTLPELLKDFTENSASHGAVAPQDGELFSLIVDGVDTDVFQFFLDELAKAVPKKEDIRQILILDNASWHKASRLNWHHFEPKFLPGYSPDFNPIERLWLRLKADWFWDYI